MKNSKLSILLLFLVMILAISAVSAADTNETSDSDVQAVDEASVEEVASADVDDIATTDDADVLSAGEQNFTQLQTAVNTGSVLMTNDYVRQAGEDTISVNNDVTIVGNEIYKIDGNNLGGIFNVTGEYTLTLIGVILINGNAENGGAIYNDGGTLTITDSSFINNSAAKSGGAIYNDGGSLSIIGSSFTNNTAAKSGGATIFTNSSSAFISESSITNKGNDDGYAIYNLGTLALPETVVDTVIYNDGIIEGNIVARLNDNLTLPADIGATVPLNATLKVGRNVIYDPRFNITVNNDDVPTEFADGFYTAEYLIEHSGDYIISTHYDAANTIEIGIYAVKANVPEFTVYVSDKPYGENITVYVSLYGVGGEGLNVTDLVVIINNEEYPVNITYGEGSFNVPDLMPGDYSALGIFEGTSDYNNAYATGTFTVLDTGLEIMVNIDDTIYLDDALIEVLIANDASFTGVVDVYVGQRKFSVAVVDGEGYLYINGIPAETYYYHAEFNGDGVYAPVVTEDKSFNVAPRYVYLDVNTYDGVACGEVGNIKVVLIDMDGTIISDEVELLFTDENGDPINWTVITTAKDIFGSEGSVELEFTKDLAKGKYNVTVSSWNFHFMKLYENDMNEEDDSVTFEFTSYGDEELNVKYGDGTVMVIGDEINGFIPVKVLTNEFDDSFIDRVFYIDADADTDGTTLYRLYELNSVPVYVKVVEEIDEDVFAFVSYGDALGSVEYGSGTVMVIGDEVDGFIPVQVLANEFDDSFVGRVFYIDANANADDDLLHTLYEVAPVDIWVTVSGPEPEVWNPATVEYPVHANYIDAIVLDGDGEYEYGEEHIVVIQLVNNVDDQELIDISCPGDVTIYSVDEDGNMTPIGVEGVEFVDGVLLYDVSDFEPGNYILAVTINDDDYEFHTEYEGEYFDTILFYDDEALFSVVPAEDVFDIFISGTYPTAEIIIEGPSGNYHVYIDDIEVVIDLDILDMGIVIYTTEGIDAGDHTGYVVFDGNGTYPPDTGDFKFTVEKATSDVIIFEPIDDVVYGNNVRIIYEMINGTFQDSEFILKDAKGNMGFTLYYDDETVTAYDLPAGIYTLTIYNTGDANHDESVDSATFEVIKDEALDIEFSNLKTFGVYCTFGVNITVAPDATGIIYINRNGITNVEELFEGGYYYFDEIITPEDGIYTIEVFYLGDDNYNATFGSQTLIPEYSNIITNDTFYGYFDADGVLYDDVTFDELIFVGNFSNLGVNVITINKPIKIYSEGETWPAVFYDMGLSIIADDVTVSNLAFVNSGTDFSNINNCAAIYVEADNVALDHIGMTYFVPEDANSYGIYIFDSYGFSLNSSVIYFIGNESNANYQHGIRVEYSDDVYIAGNSLYAALPSSYRVSYTDNINDNLVLAVGIQNGDNIVFTDNEVVAHVIDKTSYSTLDAVMVCNVTDLEITCNDISLIDQGNTGIGYYYAVDLYSFEGIVAYNNIVVNTTTGTVGSGAAYAIQVNGPSAVDVLYNNLTSISNGPTAGIMTSVEYGDIDLTASFNNIYVIGSAGTDYWALTTGIELQVGAKVYDNKITVKNVGEYEDGINLYGISNKGGITVDFLDIENNEVYSDGEYAIYIRCADDGTVTGNFLIAYDLVGDEAVCDDTMEAIDVYGNYPADLELIVYAYNVNVTEDIIIDIFTNELFNGQVIVVINGVHNVDIVDGEGTLILDSLPANTYVVTAFYEGDDYFPYGYDEDTFEVLRYVSEMTITTGDVLIYEDLEVNITLPGVTGNIKVIFDGENDTLILIDGLGSFIIPDYYMDVGNHTIKAIFEGNDLYDSATAIKEFTVEKAENYTFIVNITIDEITIGDNITFNVILPEDAYGEIIVSVNGEEVAWEEVEDGKATATIPADAFTAGMNNTVEVTYTDDDKYAETTIEMGIYANKLTYDLSATAKNIELDQNATIIVNLPADADGNAYATLQGNYYHAVDGIITIENLTEGTYTAYVLFIGDSKYKDNQTKVTFNVTKVAIPAEDAFNITTPVNATSPEFTINLPEDATGFLLLDINGTQTHVPLVNGTATARIPSGFTPGNYSAVVTYTGDDKYAPITTTQNVTVESNVPDNAFTIPDTALEGEPLTYSISLPSDAKGFLEVVVDGNPYVAALQNGSANITVPGLPAGSHNVTVSYISDGKYSPVTKSMTMNVPAYKITGNKDIEVVYTANASYNFLVTKDGKAVGAGESVVITFKGKKYTVKTDSKGYATLKLNTEIKVGEYIVTAEYKGVKVTNKVTIKHLIKAKNAKVKKSKKVSKIKVKTEKVNGKYLKGKTLKLKIKAVSKSKSGKKAKSTSKKSGKSKKKVITAKINKKGKATFKLTKKFMKKLKPSKKYTYTVSYGKDKVTKKLKVKK